MLGGLLMLLPPFIGSEKYQYRRVASLLLTLLQVACSIWLMVVVTQNGALIYAVGDWQTETSNNFYKNFKDSLNESGCIKPKPNPKPIPGPRPNPKPKPIPGSGYKPNTSGYNIKYKPIIFE